MSAFGNKFFSFLLLTIMILWGLIQRIYHYCDCTHMIFSLYLFSVFFFSLQFMLLLPPLVIINPIFFYLFLVIYPWFLSSFFTPQWFERIVHVGVFFFFFFLLRDKIKILGLSLIQKIRAISDWISCYIFKTYSLFNRDTRLNEMK